jgi:HK97 gp10 family phage protein
MSLDTKNIQGADSVVAMLNKLDADAPKFIAKANRAGAKLLKTAAEGEAPVRSGFLKSQIRIRTSNKKSKGVYRATVGVGKKDWTGEAFYASFVLWGHKAGPRTLGDSRKEVPANDFLKRTGASSGEAAADAVIDSLKTSIEAKGAA